MRTPRTDASSSLLIHLFVYLLAGLQGEPLASALVALVEAAIASLRSAQRNVESAAQATLMARARSSAADVDLDRAVNLFEANLLVSVGRNRKNRVYRALFPNGLTAVTRVRTELELRIVRTLEEAIRRELPESPMAAEHLPKITAARELVERRIAEWKTAAEALAVARSAEAGVRSEAREKYRSAYGQLLHLFPGDPRKVEAFFLRPSEVRAVTGEDEQASETPSVSGPPPSVPTA